MHGSLRTTSSLVMAMLLLAPSAVLAARVTDGLVALYTLEEGSGSVAHDSVSPPLDIINNTPTASTWIAGGVSVNTTTVFSSAAAATKIYNACLATDQVTVEAWIRPANLTQDGPARILNSALDTGERNFTLGQDADRLVWRLRTSTGSLNGNPYLYSTTGALTTNLHHVVATFEASGRMDIYVDGVSNTHASKTGTLDNWDMNYRFSLANELTHDRPWVGEIHLAAVYSRALTQAEVLANFAAGPNPIPDSPTATPTRTRTMTSTRTPSPTFTATPSPTVFLSRTATPVFSPTASFSATATRTVSPTVSPSGTSSRTPTATRSATLTPSGSATASPTPTVSATRTASASRTATRTSTPVLSATPSSSATPIVSATRTVVASMTPSPAGNAGLPDGQDLMAYPQPAAGDTLHFQFRMSGPGTAVVEVYTVTGERVARLHQAFSQPGVERLSWPLQGVAPGVYLYNLSLEKPDGEVQRFPLHKTVVIRNDR